MNFLHTPIYQRETNHVETRHAGPRGPLLPLTFAGNGERRTNVVDSQKGIAFIPARNSEGSIHTAIPYGNNAHPV